MDQYSYVDSRPQRPKGQWGNTHPTFSSNTGFHPNQTTYSSGSRNNGNGNANANSRNQNQNHKSHKSRDSTKKRGARKNNKNNNINQLNGSNWPTGPRQQNNRSYQEGQNFQSSSHQRPWMQQPSNQGRGYNGNNNRSYRNQEMRRPYPGQENQRPYSHNNNNRYNQSQNQPQYPSADMLDWDMQTLNSDECISDDSSMDYGMSSPTMNMDIDMPDAPPLFEEVCIFHPMFEKFVKEALASQQVNVNSLMYEIANEIDELKRQNKQLSEAVVNMLLRNWGISPQG